MRKTLKYLVLLLIIAALPLTVFAQAQQDPVEAGELALGDEVTGEISDDERAFAYTITLEEDAQIVAILSAEDFDCYLTLLDEDGEEIAFDDDGAGNLDSQITYSAEAGTYMLVAQSYSYRNGSGAGIAGDFTLSLNQRVVNSIEYGDRLEGEITGDDELADGNIGFAYTFMGSTGDVIVAEHFSGDYDSYLLLELNGSQLSYNDDGAGNLDSRLGPFTLPDDGEYTLIVRSLGGDDTGTFEVTLNTIASVTLEFAEKTTAELTSDTDVLYFQFEASVGDIISVQVDSEVDTNLSISDPSNYTVTSDEDSGSGNNPEISEFSLSSDGLYTLIIRATETGEGPVEVVVDRAEVPTLNEGPQTLAFSSTTFTRTLVFDAEGDVQYRITFELIDGDFGSPSIDITQDDVSLGYTSTSRVQRLSIDITPDSDGEVVLRTSDYSYANIEYQVTLEVIGE